MTASVTEFKNLFEFLPKSGLKAADGSTFGNFPFFTSSSIVSKWTNSPSYQEESLVFATGGKAAVHHTTVQFSASNDCLVARAKDGRTVSPKFVYYYLNWNIREVDAGFRGAGLKHVSKRFIQSIKIPLPSIEYQQRIVTILDKADKLRTKRREAIAKLDTLAQSIFIDMFGDPVTNPMGWEKPDFSKVVSSIRYGTGSPPEYVESGIPFIRATNIKNGTIRRSDLKFISEYQAEKISKCRLNGGELIVVRSGVNSGDSAMIPRDLEGAYAGFDLIIELEHSQAVFYNTLINSRQGQYLIKPLTRRAAQPHLNANQLGGLQLISPPADLLDEFVVVVETQIERQEALSRNHFSEITALFSSLQQRAFKGEL